MNERSDARGCSWARSCFSLLVIIVMGCGGRASSREDDDGDERGEEDGPDEGADDGGSDGSGGGTALPPEVVGPRPSTCAKGPGDPRPVGLRRLTVLEAHRSLEVALGVPDVELTKRLPHDVRAPEGFRTSAGVLTASAEFVAGVYDTATVTASSADQVVERIAPCNRFDAACEQTFIEGLGLRLLRRPLEADQVTAFRRLFQVAKEHGDTFAAGAGLVIRAMMQSPQFLYRVEREDEGAVRTVDAWELASRLSFLAWGTGPDDELFAAAKSGKLADDDELGRQLGRLLEDARAKEPLRSFAAEWLGIDDLADVQWDSERYRDLTPELKADMLEESLRFIEEAWDENLPVPKLATADFTWASERLARVYGLPDARPGTTRYDLAGHAQRMGVLTQGSFLTAHAGGRTPKVVERGITVFKTVLCQQPVPPPPGTNVQLNQKPLGPGVTERTNSEARLEAGVCGACHKQFDPLAHPFERFDAMGRYAEKDEHGNALRWDGTLAFLAAEEDDVTPRDYADLREFTGLIAEDRRLFSCLVQKPAQYALGRGFDPEGDDACYLHDLRAAAAKAGGSLRAVLAAVARHPHFRLVAAGSL